MLLPCYTGMGSNLGDDYKNFSLKYSCFTMLCQFPLCVYM